MAFFKDFHAARHPNQKGTVPLTSYRIPTADCFLPLIPALKAGQFRHCKSAIVIDGESNIPGLSGSTGATSGPFVGAYGSGGTGAWGAAGYVATAAASAIFAINKYPQFTLEEGDLVIVAAKVKVASIVQVSNGTSVQLLIGKTSTDPITTPTTDFIGIDIAAAATPTVKLRARGNGGTAADTASLATPADDTFFYVMAYAYVSATTAEIVGGAWANATGFNAMTEANQVPLTSSQKTQIAALLTTPATDVCPIIATKNGNAGGTGATTFEKLFIGCYKGGY